MLIEVLIFGSRPLTLRPLPTFGGLRPSIGLFPTLMMSELKVVLLSVSELQ